MRREEVVAGVVSFVFAFTWYCGLCTMFIAVRYLKVAVFWFRGVVEVDVLDGGSFFLLG